MTESRKKPLVDYTDRKILWLIASSLIIAAICGNIFVYLYLSSAFNTDRLNPYSILSVQQYLITALIFLAVLVPAVLFIRKVIKQKWIDPLQALTIALKNHELQFNQLLEHIDEALWLCTADGLQTLYISPAYERITGRTCKELYADPNLWLKNIHPDDLPRVMKTFAQKGQKGERFTSTYRISRPDGETRIVCDTGFPVVDEQGKLIQIVGSLHDITEQEKNKAILAKLKRTYEYILNSAGEGIFGLDAEGKITFINPAAAKMLGWKSEHLAHKSHHDLFHHSKIDGTAYPQEDCPIHTSIHEGKVHQVNNEIFWRQDGTYFQVEYTCNPITDSDNQLAGAVVVFRDISEKLKLESDLQIARKLEAVGQLAAGIAHEINTPAQYVGDNLCFLSESFDNLVDVLAKYDHLRVAVRDGSETREPVEQVDNAIETADLEFLLEEIPLSLEQSREGIDNISTIVKAMKEFSHPGSKDKDYSDINHIIKTTVTVTKNEWKYVADVKLDLDEDLPSVPCYTQEISQTIMNLIVNAAHAIGDVVGDQPDSKGTISLSTKRLDDEEVEIRVRDTGTGIPANIVDKIFDPFFTTKEVGKGTGQGLAIARYTITDKHGGTIKCKCTEGEGTTFIIRLPASDAGEKDLVEAA